jgi:hypothetical protein
MQHNLGRIEYEANEYTPSNFFLNQKWMTGSTILSSCHMASPVLFENHPLSVGVFFPSKTLPKETRAV